MTCKSIVYKKIQSRMACIEVFIYKSIVYKKIQPELDEVNCAKENVFFSSTKKLSVCEH